MTDCSRKLEGVLSFKKLLLADADAVIGDIMNKRVISVSTDTDQEEVVRTLQELDLLAIPVADKEGWLVGIITVDDAMDILEDEATEDIYKQTDLDFAKIKEGNRSNTLINGGLISILKLRVPILILVLIGGFVAGMIVEGFEEALQAATVIAFFIPLIMDMGGSVGGQSTTVFARGFVLGQIKAGSLLKQFLKEASVGLSIGAVVAFFAFFGVGIWLGEWNLAIAVSLALVVNCTIAASVGFLVPLFLIKIGFDQAASSGPIITSIKDISGLLVYFLLIILFMDLEAYSVLSPYEAAEHGLSALENLQRYA